ncbi:aldo-keto reductase family 1 member C15-like isoform X1 [Papio anubis]|uniref:aldo-keto reductase family 1 member C15-like isoform X1 n=1 Tax=Papio anubis TaxID=9555 RepID=UPI0012AE2381|nr:aldo-keto reductase family 1 member C15-like isoform X1 [Papio anubis]
MDKLQQRSTIHFLPSQALEKCKDAGLTKSIGVSNFNRKLLELILNKPGLKYKPTCNQVECHPYLNQSKLLEFCKSKNIVLVAYSALASHRDPNWMDPDSPYLLEEPTLKSIAKKHSRSPGQVALRYQLQWGVVVLAKSFSEKRIKENFQVQVKWFCSKVSHGRCSGPSLFHGGMCHMSFMPVLLSSVC